MIKSRKRRINWPGVVIGLAILCIQYPFLSVEMRFVRASKVVSGKVVKLNAGRHPQVEFTTLEGQRISVPASAWSSIDVGDVVEMRYDPREPRIAEMNTLWGMWGIQLMAGWIAACFILGGLLGLPSSIGLGLQKDNDAKE
ncbi:conserved hypothetical protein [Burkholderia sp. 8Y]|uniref:DUF3592 domain-containing protein n=1 Tax=Burkholderia sp. 8Y TaxID=2653133 RepID=UPI0012F231FA|nr:DUF3592 domain-containing protein [Burkholderia sp. 8Y]VXC97290.1 conserved hypothetical protein [Burkholderia sp. 8Y]